MTFNPPFAPPLGLTNPHVQTILSSVARKAIVPQRINDFVATTVEETIEVADVRLVVHKNTQPSDPHAPLVMIIPGWLGSAQSSYVLSAAQYLWQQGFNVVRVNCGITAIPPT